MLRIKDRTRKRSACSTSAGARGGNTPDSALVHWGLAHFLLDGHHKVEAAARAGARLRLLSLLSVDGSLADRPEIERLVAGYATR